MTALADRVDVVVKIGGGLLRDPHALAPVLAAICDAAGQAGRAPRLVIVPGGGPFADTVRAVDQRFDLSPDASHWMAVLAMDQYAHLVADSLGGARVVDGPGQIAAAFAAATLPVLAPSRWLQVADPLPHSWDVTSDSIAAWVAGALGARRLVLVKPPGSAGASDAVDPYFARALPAGLTHVLVPADDVAALRSALGEHATAD